MNRAGAPADDSLRRATRRELGVFLVSGLLCLLAVGWGTVYLSGRVAQEDALADAERHTQRLAQLVIGPLLVDVLTGRPGSTEDLEKVVGNRMADGVLHEIDVWTSDGTVVWSSEPGLVGAHHAVTPELLEAAGGATVSAISWDRELVLASTTGPATDEPELEVYAPLDGPASTTLVFEAYYALDGVDQSAAQLRAQIVPVAVGALVLLQLVQVPIALRMARRTGRQARERTRLLDRTLSASERERRVLAGQLHDGPVQDLAGLGYGLGALGLKVDEEHRPAVHRLVGVLDTAVARLRRLMVEVYPPELGRAGLRWAVQELTGPLADAGIQVDTELSDPGDAAPETTAAVYRCAREALANCLRHSGAGRVQVGLGPQVRLGVPGIRLTVDDDGVGLPPTGIDKRAEGHLGLRLLVDRAADLGGSMTVGPGVAGGTAVDLWLPLHPGP